jgi:AraC family transcriptional regulator
MSGSEILVRATRTSGAGLRAAELECASIAAPWRDLVRLERGRKPPLGKAELTMLWPTIGVMRGDSGILEQRPDGGALQTLTLSSGSVLIYPEGASVSVRMVHAMDSTILQIAPALLSEAAQQLGEPSRLVTAWLPGDEPIERIATLFETELRSGCTSGRPYGEYLARTLATYLVRRHAKLPGPPSATSPLRKDKIGAALQYIQANPIQDVSIPKLAKTVHLSPYHFSRLFKQSTGLTPHQYVLNYRIEEAKRLLRHTVLPLSEIAQRLGFRDQSHFTARFRKSTGVTPKRWRDKS